MAARTESGAPARRAARALLVALYLAFVAAGFFWPWQPRAFWTVALPLLVLFIVVAGFHAWRDLCPLAFFGELGRKLNRGKQRKMPEGLESRYLLVPFLVLAAMLALRLVATNGDGRWLAGLLIGLAVAAASTNAVFTGKSWCNFLCPVGFVERVYTDPSSLRRTANSQCVRCTACKRSCPDIDQENNYWRELGDGGRRVATYAFPGLVLAFYGYFWLRSGDWEAYFDGRWTRMPAGRELAFGPGFFFAPGVPALAAAALTIALLSAASYVLFAAVERGIGRVVTDEERRRHLALSLAAFAAFNCFYFFAGAPTLRKISGGTRTLAFLVPALATVVLARRWRRSRESYVKEKGAAKLLRNWPFEEPPPADPAEAYALVQATERARERVLAGYTQTLREMLTDGILRDGERRLLDELRKQFGITPREHDKVVGELAEEQREALTASGGQAGVESRLQLESYQEALADAVLRQASAAEIDELRRAFGVSQGAHAALVERMRGGAGPMLARARRRVEEAQTAAADRAALAAGEASAAKELAAYLLRRTELRAVERALDALESIGDSDLVRLVRPAILGESDAGRRAGLRQLGEACPGAGEAIAALSKLLLEPPPAAPGGEGAALARLLASPDRYLRAAALWAAAEGAPATERAELLRRGGEDVAEIVRATATILAERPTGAAAGYLDLGPIERMQFLRRVPLLAGLEAEDLEELAAFAREETVEPGVPICAQGVPDAGDLFVLLDGTASVAVRAIADDPASEREVAELGANEIVGELALVDGSPRSATVRPKGGPLRLLRIPGPAFRARLLRRESVASALLATLTQRVRSLSGRIAAAEQ